MNRYDKFKKQLNNDDSKISSVLLTIVVVFVSFLMMSNILANRMIKVGIFSMDAGTLTFPVTYVLSDLVSEVYGYKWSRRITWYATIMNGILATFIKLCCALPCPDYFDPAPFENALSGSYRIVVASLCSYAVGDLFNDMVFAKMKKQNRGGFALRAVLSSVVGETIDSTVFVLGAFLFTMPLIEIPKMIVLNIVVKVCYEIIILPVTVRVTAAVKSLECR